MCRRFIVKFHDKIAYKNDLGQHILPSNLEVTVYESSDTEAIGGQTGEKECTIRLIIPALKSIWRKQKFLPSPESGNAPE